MCAAETPDGLINRNTQGNQAGVIAAYMFDFSPMCTRPTGAHLAQVEDLASLVLEAERSQQAYGLCLPGQFFEPDLSVAQRERCLKALALFGIEDAN